MIGLLLVLAVLLFFTCVVLWVMLVQAIMTMEEFRVDRDKWKLLAEERLDLRRSQEDVT